MSCSLNASLLRGIIAFVIFASSAPFAEALKIGIYFGTFDPPHPGHIRLVIGGNECLELDVTLVYVNLETPFKPEASAFVHRYAMSELAFGGLPRTVVVAPATLTQEISGREYSIFLEEFAARHPDDEIYVLYGNDAYEARFSGQYGAHAALPPRARNLHIAVTSRDGRAIPRFPGIEIETFASGVAYSSTGIRAAIRSGEAVVESRMQAVLQYIAGHGLYRELSPGACVVKVIEAE